MKYIAPQKSSKKVEIRGNAYLFCIATTLIVHDQPKWVIFIVNNIFGLLNESTSHVLIDIPSKILEFWCNIPTNDDNVASCWLSFWVRSLSFNTTEDDNFVSSCSLAHSKFQQCFHLLLKNLPFTRGSCLPFIGIEMALSQIKIVVTLFIWACTSLFFQLHAILFL